MNMPHAPGDVSFKLVIGVILFAGSCIAAALYADDRYAKTQDLKAFVSQSNKNVEAAANMIRKQLLEDKIFEADLVPDAQKSDVQRAIANRSKTQLQEVQSRITKSEQERQ